MSRRVVLATRNEHKVHELRQILAGLVDELDLEIVSAAEVDGPDVPETEVTFLGNARLKAVALAEATGLPSVADDSGLAVEVLGGSPGVFSARWSGSHAGDGAARADVDRANLSLLLEQVADDSGLAVEVLGGSPGVFSARWSGSHAGDGAARADVDRANLSLLLEQVADVPDEHRAAAFVCAAVVALPDGRVEGVEGRVEGTLGREPRGTNGFGYDPVFHPTGDTRTLAEYTDTEKNAISHRGNAFRALEPVLRTLLSADPQG
jgi:XTP/dITP diphosphohydrolase